MELFEIIEEGDLNEIESSIKNGCDINATDDNNNTALMSAICFKPEVVELLLDSGANVNMKNYLGWTALMMASDYGYKEVVKLLIDNNADISKKNSAGKTALTLAKENRHNDIVEILKNAEVKSKKTFWRK